MRLRLPGPLARMPLVSRPKKRTALARKQAPAGRGVALIFVLTTIAILTVVAVDFSYGTRVNLELAAGSRDSLRARSLAMSGMNYARMLLRFQRQIDMAGAGLGQGLDQLMQGMNMDMSQLTAAAAAAGVDPAQVQSILQTVGGGGQGMGAPTIRLWDVVPLDTAMASLVGNAFRDDTKPRAQQDRRQVSAGMDEGETIDVPFADFEGGFTAKISDEDQKINVQRLEYSLGGGPAATLLQLSVMMDDPKYDFIFNEEDSNRERVDRPDVLTALKDWIDTDETGSGRPDLTSPLKPFPEGFGDENGPYLRYTPRYRAKNAKFDTLDELYQVWGVNDAFMAAFGDRLTVFPDTNAKLNLNTTDPLQMLINVLVAARNPAEPALRDPLRLALIMQEIELSRRMLPFIGLSVPRFVAILKANGIPVKAEIEANTAQNVFLGDKSTTFRIVASGQAGRVKKTLTAVVRYDDGLGQLLYWHEE